MKTPVAVTLCAVGALLGCSDDKGPGSGGQTVPATAHIVKGPSGATAFAPGFASAALVDGQWVVTADQTTLTIDHLEFDDLAGGPIHVPLTGCSPTYSSDAATLSTILDCDFDIPVGTWRRIGVAISTTFDMNVFDAGNNLYTDPASATGLSTIAPAGPTDATFTIEGPGGVGDVQTPSAFLQPPLVVTVDDVDVTISLVADMLHAMRFTESSGVLSLAMQVPPVELMPSAAGAGRVQFYSDAPGVQNYNTSVFPGSGAAVRLFYPGATGQPGYVMHPVLGPSQAYASDASNGGAGGFLGVDSTGKLCWAHAVEDSDFTSYNKVCVMQLSTALGATTSLSCETVTDAPPPVSGSTYASGCPAITPDETFTVQLIGE